MRDEYFIFLHFTPNNIAFAFFSLAPQHRRLKAVFLLGGDAHIREAAFGRIQKDGTDERLRYLVQREARRKQRHRHALRRRLIAEQIIGQCALKARVEPNIKQPLHYIAQLCVHISLRLCEPAVPHFQPHRNTTLPGTRSARSKAPPSPAAKALP